MTRVAGDRLTLLSIHMDVKGKFKAVELKSAILPACWLEVDLYIEVFELLFCLWREIENHEKVLGVVRDRKRNYNGDNFIKNIINL